MDNRKSMAATGGRPRVFAAFAFVALIFGAASSTGGPAAAGTDAPAGKAFTICNSQKYALCATSACTMYNNVAYCKCDTEKGDSISLTLPYPGGDICDFNAAGEGNGYMMSTFSTPPSVVKDSGDQAVYDCDAETATGAYAQCDGGVCFKSTKGNSFPGFSGTLADDEIICSCPTVVADPKTAKTGYQIIGPFPCEKDFFQYCKKKTANTDNGSTIYVGAPTGSARYLSRKLDGTSTAFNHCVR